MDQNETQKLFGDFSRKLATETLLDRAKFEKDILKGYQDILHILTSSYENYLKHISSALGALEQNNTRSLSYSLYIFYNLFNEFKKKEIRKLSLEITDNSCTEETYKKYAQQLEIAVKKNNRPRISNFPEFDENVFSLNERGEIMSLILDLVEEKSKQIELSQDDITAVTIQLPVLRNLCNSTNSQAIFYFVCGQFIDRLNTSEFNQVARDTAEEIVLASFRDDVRELGFYESFFCYATQRSTHSAIFYANLCLYTYKTRTTFVYDRFLTQFISTTIKYFRNIHFEEEGIRIYKESKNLNISQYEKRNLDHLYFTCRLESKDTSAPVELKEYLTHTLSYIIKGTEHDATPWLVLLYNAKRLHPIHFKGNHDLQYFIDNLESKVPENVKQKTRDILFGSTKDLKQWLKRTLLKLNETNFVEDLHYDNQQALLISNRLLENGTNDKDPEGFLLAMLIKSDFSLLFVEKTRQRLNELKIPNLDSERYNEIFPEVLNSMSNISSSNSKVEFNWLGHSEGKSFQLHLHAGIFRHFKLTKWDAERFRKLQDEDYFQALTFNDTLRDESGIYQTTPEEYELQSESILESLKSFKIFVDETTTSLFLVKDMSLTAFPHNLLINSKNQFIHIKKPITNILSSEWYLKDLGRDQTIKPSKAIWIPIEEQDWTINKLYSSLEQVLNENEFSIHTSSAIDKPISAELNIICSHGAKDISQNQVVYPSDLPIFNLDKYIGKGEILIFFVCHSGSYSNDFLRNNISSIVKTYINKGYRAIIAPFWALHVNIPEVWLSAFLASMRDGSQIDGAVFKANQMVYTHFPHPAAWSAMHLYGSPHLKYTEN